MATRSAVDRDISDALEALVGAAMEVQNGAELFEGVALVGDFAQESAFKDRATSFDKIHLASHTLIDHENPLYSRLVFANDSSRSEDGLLHLYELYGMQLNASLVGLSACNTGIGKFYRGEGMLSLAKGFMGAGAKNVMMSLWSVSDQSTSDLMQSFYANLKNGVVDYEALRMAKLEYLEDADPKTSHPYYWSGFVFVGNGTPGKDGKLKMIAAVVLLILIPTMVVIARRRGSKAA